MHAGLLHRSLGLALSLSLLAGLTSAGAVPPFSDVGGHPFEEHIEWMRQAGLTDSLRGSDFEVVNTAGFVNGP